MKFIKSKITKSYAKYRAASAERTREPDDIGVASTQDTSAHRREDRERRERERVFQRAFACSLYGTK